MSADLTQVAVVANFAELRTYFGAGLPPVCIVQGTTTPFAGGGGLFAIDFADKTTADNNSSVVVDNSGYRWKRLAAAP